MIKTLVCHKCTQTSAHRQATTYHPTEQRAKKFHFINCFLQIQNVITYFPGTFDIFTLWLGIWSYPEVNCLAGHRLHWKALVERQTWPSAGCRGEGAAQLGVRFCYQNLARDEEEIMSWAAVPSSHFQRLRKALGQRRARLCPSQGWLPQKPEGVFELCLSLGFGPAVFLGLFLSTKPSSGEQTVWSIRMQCSSTDASRKHPSREVLPGAAIPIPRIYQPCQEVQWFY